MKPLVILAIALGLAGGAWWISNDVVNNEDGISGDAVNISVDEAAQHQSSAALKDENEGDPAGISDEGNELLTEQVSESAGDDVIRSESQASPFAVVEGDEPVSEPAAVSQPQSTELPTDREISANDSIPQDSLEPIVVPSSYPVTDAEKYFIPREERRPGRLGGPPPLNFPGGPSDPNRDSNLPFQPPTAPGQ